MRADSVPDARERELALDPTRSLIVQAPAGSGKTGLLIQRYLALLAIVEEPEQIIALTFTRKAAGEMRQRILDALQLALGGEPEAAHERTTWRLARRALDADRRRKWRLRDNPGRLRVQTIDSLSTELARQMPVLSRFGAQPEIVEDAAELYREAARQTLALVEGGGERSERIYALLEHLGCRTDVFVELVSQLLGRRDQWLRHLGGKADEDWRADLEASLRRVVAAKLEAAREKFPPERAADLVWVARQAVADVEESSRNPGFAALAGSSGLPGTDAADLGRWKAIASLLLTRRNDWRKRVDRSTGLPADQKAAKKRLLDLLEALAGRDDARAALADVRDLPDPAYSEGQWQTLLAVVSVLPLAAAELRLVFAERGQADFVEVAERAIAALGSPVDPTDLLLSLDRRIQHLLVDEFQDTSRNQFALLRLLTAGWEPGDGRTLFLVGDPMQSIYRFRAADVGLFLEAQERGIGDLKLERLGLTTNFRSGAGIVDWVNRTFRDLFPKRSDVSAGAVVYQESESVSDLPAAVRFHATLQRDDDAEAREVVAVVRRDRDGASPPPRIGILVRSRTHLASIVVALSEAGLRYQAQEVAKLSSQPVIQDLLALTRAIVASHDRIAWLACLRAPWCGLTLADLQRLCRGAPEEACLDLVRDDRRLETLSADGRERCRRFRSIIEPALGERGRWHLRDLVEGAWIGLGGPACVDDQAMADAADFFELLSRCESAWTISTPERIEEKLEGFFSRPDPHADGSIQVMTMHKAKGLEFDVVILPGLGRPPKREAPRLLYWLERAEGLLLAPLKRLDRESDDPIYDLLKELDAESLNYETTRLVYVAATRAKRELHLFAHARLDKDGRTEAEPRSLLKTLWPALATSFADLPRLAAGDDGRRGEEPAPPALRRIASAWRLPEPAPALRAGAPEQPAAAEESRLEFHWAGDTARHVGTAVHAALCRIGREGLGRWSAERIREARLSLRAALASAGVAPAELEDATDRTVAVLVAAIESERGRWILSAHPEARSEVPLSGKVGGKLMHAVLDRTFVDERGARWVIDYKTGRHEGADLEAFLDRERERYREQLETYGALMARLEARPLRFGLYYPQLGGWREW